MYKPFVDLGRNSSPLLDKDDSATTETSQLDASVAKLAEEIDESKREQMSPAGALGLPDHLDKKRLEHGIIDDHFKVCAAFDRILLYQLPATEKTFGKSSIIMPQISEKRKAQETPTGIIVSAGLGALDVMRSHGHELGDTVMFVKQGLWRITTGYVRHVDEHLMVLSVGDIVSNQDLAQRLIKGEVRYHFDEEEGGHYIVDRHGKKLKPQTPFVGADYE